MMKVIPIHFAFVVIVTQIVTSAYAYDSTGHMIVQQIALLQLNEVAKQNIEALVAELRTTPNNGAYDEVSISCWLDDIRHHQSHDFHTWHFIDLGQNGEGPQIPMSVGDLNNENENVVTALKRAVAVLKGGNDPLIQNKPVALALVCHLIGDIPAITLRQPLFSEWTQGRWFRDRRRRESGKGDKCKGP
jgi:hypothetical protein